MSQKHLMSTLFLDIEGVLRSDGGDYHSCKKAVEIFNVDHEDMEKRHHINFETYELGKMTLDEYLQRFIFYEIKNLSADNFKIFMFQQSLPYPKMIELFIQLKKEYRLKIAVISNEGKELNEYPIKKFKLNNFIDFFISSSIVNLRKPDAEIFILILSIAKINTVESVYIDNQPMFVKIAEGFGMKGIYHTDYDSTVAQLQDFGLTIIPSDHG